MMNSELCTSVAEQDTFVLARGLSTAWDNAVHCEWLHDFDNYASSDVVLVVTVLISRLNYCYHPRPPYLVHPI